MKSILFIFLLISFSLTVFSQDSQEFIGYLSANKTVITYKITFRLDEKGLLNGESITDIYGSDRTASSISGSYDKINKIISFKEIKNTSTKSNADQNDFCFVNVLNLKLKVLKDNVVLDGGFIGYNSKSKKCAEGKIHLVSSFFFNGLKVDGVNIDSLRQLEKLEISSLASSLVAKEFSLKGNCETSLKWSSKNIIIEVWDNFSEDGDIVNVFIDSKKIGGNVVLRNEKYILKSNFINSKSTIKIVALSEGSTPTTTVNILFIDGVKQIPIIARLKKGEVVCFNLSR